MRMKRFVVMASLALAGGGMFVGCAESKTCCVAKEPEAALAASPVAAKETLTSQKLLADLAKNAGDAEVRYRAIKGVDMFHTGLTNQALLADVVKNAQDPVVRAEAVAKLTDQVLLAELAKNDKDLEVRRTAVQQLTDHALLAELAKNDKAPEVRRAAVITLVEQITQPTQ
ncbi:MAG: HEAT repeat domain-containing protein [Phycisphaerales bacterium]|nr:HEAT repeat domain-containing protein [Phycisphaerales bacterium]